MRPGWRRGSCSSRATLRIATNRECDVCAGAPRSFPPCSPADRVTLVVANLLAGNPNVRSLRSVPAPLGYGAHVADEGWLQVTRSCRIPVAELEWRVGRSGGPG